LSESDLETTGNPRMSVAAAAADDAEFVLTDRQKLNGLADSRDGRGETRTDCGKQ
jgi:hypothetical protein